MTELEKDLRRAQMELQETQKTLIHYKYLAIILGVLLVGVMWLMEQVC